MRACVRACACVRARACVRVVCVWGGGGGEAEGLPSACARACVCVCLGGGGGEAEGLCPVQPPSLFTQPNTEMLMRHFTQINTHCVLCAAYIDIYSGTSEYTQLDGAA